MYMAIELTNDAGKLQDKHDVNDKGVKKNTPQEAWHAVKDVFSPEHTVIVSKGYVTHCVTQSALSVSHVTLMPLGTKGKSVKRLIKPKQKFPKGSLVFLGAVNELAIVEYTYSQAYGGTNTESYCLNRKDGGKVAWFDEDELTLVDKPALKLLCAWRKLNKKG